MQSKVEVRKEVERGLLRKRSELPCVPLTGPPQLATASEAPIEFT